jgi:hypothetical protein
MKYLDRKLLLASPFLAEPVLNLLWAPDLIHNLRKHYLLMFDFVHSVPKILNIYFAK